MEAAVQSHARNRHSEERAGLSATHVSTFSHPYWFDIVSTTSITSKEVESDKHFGPTPIIPLIWVVSELADLYLVGWMHNLAGFILKRHSCTRPYSQLDSTMYLMDLRFWVPQLCGRTNKSATKKEHGLPVGKKHIRMEKTSHGDMGRLRLI